MKNIKKVIVSFALSVLVTSSVLCHAAPVLFGDANNDAERDIRDLVRVCRYLDSQGTLEAIAPVDYNLDGVVDDDDLPYLRRTILKSAVFEYGVDSAEFE